MDSWILVVTVPLTLAEPVSVTIQVDSVQAARIDRLPADIATPYHHEASRPNRGAAKSIQGSILRGDEGPHVRDRIVPTAGVIRADAVAASPYNHKLTSPNGCGTLPSCGGAHGRCGGPGVG